MRKHVILAPLLAIVLPLVVFLSGCEKSTHSQVSESLGQLATILAQNASLIESGGTDAENNALVDAILDAAVADGLIPNAEEYDSLFTLHPNDSAGLFLFKHLSNRRRTLSSHEAIQWCERIETLIPDTSVAALAFDVRLSELQQSDTPQFLAECQRALDAPVHERAARIAIFRRAMHYVNANDNKKAALDCLRLYTTYPAWPETSGTAMHLQQALTAAGFLLEADILESPVVPGQSASYFLADLNGLHDSPNKDSASALRAAYYQWAPDYDKVAEPGRHTQSAELTPIERAVYMARLGRIAVADLSPKKIMAAYKTLEQECRQQLAAADTPQEESGILAELCKNGAKCLLQVFGPEAYARSDEVTALKRSANVARQLAGALNTLYLDLAKHHFEPSQFPVETIEDFVERARLLNDREGIVQAYRFYVDHSPDSPHAPTVLLAAADYYMNEMKSPSQAMEMYTELYKRYPDSPEAETAFLKQAVTLYEIEQYEAAYEFCQAALADNPAGEKAATVKFIAALSEAALGAPDEAVNHMNDLVNEHPTSHVAPRGVFWIASMYLSQQDYDTAQEWLIGLQERYPDSEYAVQAREICARLKQSLDASNQAR